ncbi:MAG: hypothetical protein HY924_05160 [Elusimicrobia bacterium]|nr:hypothetical protein [Elusimicrobiota bacterium]
MEPNKSQIPSLKDTKKPELKVKGLAAGMSLVDRVKSFRKKDLAFIGAGLAVLFLAPLVEHFLMAPESGQPGAFKEGWTFRGDGAGGSSFGSGGSPYEPGVSGLAPGGLLGSGSEIITPLNVRDPSSLVMGPGQTSAQPVTAPAAAAPASASAAKPASDWKDALAAAAGRSASAATKSASLPVPKVPIQGSLRGLGVLGGGGSGASWSGGPMSAAGSSKPAGSSSLTNVKPTAGFSGVAGKRGASPAGSIEDLKKAAANAADGFNRGGSSAGNLLTAADASQAIPGGGSAGGAGGSAGEGKEDKRGGDSKDMRSNSRGEPSLEYLMKKKEMENQMDLDWEKKKKEEMFPLEMKQEIQKTLMMDGLVKPVAGAVGDGIKEALTGLFGRGSAVSVSCTVGGTPNQIVGSNIPACKTGAQKEGTGLCLAKNGPGCTTGPCVYQSSWADGSKVYGQQCSSGPKDDGSGKPTTETPENVPQTPEPGSTGPDGKPNPAGGLMNQCVGFVNSSSDAGGEFYKKLIEPTKLLITAHAYLSEVAYKDKAGKADCKGESITIPGDNANKDVKALQVAAAAELDKANKNLSAELAAVQEIMMPCVNPDSPDGKSECNTKPKAGITSVTTDLDQGAACKKVEDCAKQAETVIGNFDKTYFADAVTAGKSQQGKFEGDSSKRQTETKASLVKVKDGGEGKESGYIPDSDKLLTEINAKIEAAQKQLDAAINVGGTIEVKNDKGEMVKRDLTPAELAAADQYKDKVREIKQTLLADVQKSYKYRKEEAQKALVTAYEKTKGVVYDKVLPDDTNARASAFTKYAAAGGDAPSAGYSANLKGHCGSGCLGITAVAPESKKVVEPKLTAGKEKSAGLIKQAEGKEQEAKDLRQPKTGQPNEPAAKLADAAAEQFRKDALTAWQTAFTEAKAEFGKVAPPMPKKTGEYPRSQIDTYKDALTESDGKMNTIKGN